MPYTEDNFFLEIIFLLYLQFLLGCGGSPLFTLGTTYIDNHVKRDSSSMYIGFMYSMCAFGPVCGFLLGAYLLSHNVDTFSNDVHVTNFGKWQYSNISYSVEFDFAKQIYSIGFLNPLIL